VAATATTKGGGQDDTVLFDSTSRVYVGKVFLTLRPDAASRGQCRLMYMHSYASYLYTLNRAGRALGLPLHVVARLPRHGGASEDSHTGVRDLRQIQITGRCAHSRT
jgi:hypothetical protein